MVRRATRWARAPSSRRRLTSCSEEAGCSRSRMRSVLSRMRGDRWRMTADERQMTKDERRMTVAAQIDPSSFVVRLSGDAFFLAIQIVGVAAFAYPFVSPQIVTGEATARSSDAPIILGVTLVALFAALGTL